MFDDLKICGVKLFIIFSLITSNSFSLVIWDDVYFKNYSVFISFLF